MTHPANRLPVYQHDDGTRPEATLLGGYPLLYFTRSSLTVCAACANDAEKDESDPVVASDVFWEGPALTCDDCGVTIESAYGNPWED